MKTGLTDRNEFRNYIKWIISEHVCCIHFENIISSSSQKARTHVHTYIYMYALYVINPLVFCICVNCSLLLCESNDFVVLEYRSVQENIFICVECRRSSV
jgi:hypothetical protein